MLFKLLIGLVWLAPEPGFTHVGQHQSDACFIKMGDSQLELNGYQFEKDLAGKYFCHFFPGLGQTVWAIDTLSDNPETMKVSLALKQLVDWTALAGVPEKAFVILEQAPPEVLGANLVSVEHVLTARGVYVLDIGLQVNDGAVQRHRFWFLAGVPVTKLMVFLAFGLLGLIMLVALYRWGIKWRFEHGNGRVP